MPIKCKSTINRGLNVILTFGGRKSGSYVNGIGLAMIAERGTYKIDMENREKGLENDNKHLYANRSIRQNISIRALNNKQHDFKCKCNNRRE
ncbi:CLUMA_CG011089, isoform A [Clunio marinus]|uniref:CLUMA_CG011089, isoform A n=1 Tax=Clunio marinus TaxID=568069 RepID=A0A1J1IBQ5_9DIPT|nr:CLUMA_CG011089, isoform A [Clunio marinus]